MRWGRRTSPGQLCPSPGQLGPTCYAGQALKEHEASHQRCGLRKKMWYKTSFWLEFNIMNKIIPLLFYCSSPRPPQVYPTFTSWRSRVTQTKVPSTVPSLVSYASDDGDSTGSLDNLYQRSITLRVKSFFMLKTTCASVFILSKKDSVYLL